MTHPTVDAAEMTVEASVPTRIAQHRRYLMCRPEHFTVRYSINPWMHPDRPTDTDRALAQWTVLYDTYRELGHDVELIDPVDGLPDMVYTANGGFVIDGTAYGVKFRVEERQGEARPFMDWFAANGFDVVEPDSVNEGEGDFLLVGDTILAGAGFRSTNDSHSELTEVFGREVVSLNLVDPRFYHLDTAISVLDPVDASTSSATGGAKSATDVPARANIAYLPSAFDAESRATLQHRYPDAILVSEADGDVFGLNSASDGYNVFISPRATGFERQLRERGYNPVLIDLSELLLGGGGIKCCTLELRAQR